VRRSTFGSGYDAYVNLELLGAAETHEFALLNHAQKFGLRFGANGGDFIKENGALIGDFEEALFGSNGAGEGALTWPKSWDSRRSTGIDPVFTGTKALSARVEAE